MINAMQKIVRKRRKQYKIKKLMKEGFSYVSAEKYVSEMGNEDYKKYNKQIVKFSKKHGFLCANVVAYGINENNYHDYLCDKDYCKLFPLDGEYHSWIDNKLELKYLLGDLGKYMPEYYFQITKNNGILKLLDCPDSLENNINGVLELLYDKGKFGIKAVRGYGGADFFKAEIINGNIFVNDKEFNEKNFSDFIVELDNFIIMEYLESSGLLSEIYPKTANSIRYLIGVDHGKQYKIGNFVKFGRKGSGYIDNLTGGGITCPIDENGYFSFGYESDNGVLKEIYAHPDTKHELCGKIENWDEIESIVQKIIKRLPQLTHMGFDFVISDKGVKLLEINDKSGLMTIQKNRPLMKNKENNFYWKKLSELKRG